MIAYLKGKIIKKTEKGVILGNNGVGYMVFTTRNSLIEINDEELEFFIHSHIREDIFDLYGFLKIEEMEFFKQLISVNGIGPKVALEILETEAHKVKNAILNSDSAFLSRIPGIGKKTAERLILELKNKVTPSEIEANYRVIPIDIHDEVTETLTNLGFQRNHIHKRLSELPKEITSTEEIIKFFLKQA